MAATRVATRTVTTVTALNVSSQTKAELPAFTAALDACVQAYVRDAESPYADVNEPHFDILHFLEYAIQYSVQESLGDTRNYS